MYTVELYARVRRAVLVGGQVLRVTGAAAVAAPRDLASGAQGGRHGQRNRLQHGLLGFHLVDNLQVLCNGFAEDACGTGTAGHGSLAFRSYASLAGAARAGQGPGGRKALSCYDSGVNNAVNSSFPGPVQTVFLDRDGVVNEKMPEGHYVTRWSEFQVLPGVAEAIGRLNRAGLRMVVVSNQRGIALGLYTAEDVRAIHAEFQKLLEAFGAHVDGFYFCPHDRGQCNCRKPLPGLFEKAAAEFPEITAATSIIIGDTLSDIEFGRRLGMLTVFIEGDPERRNPWVEEARKMADLRFSSLAEAVNALLASQLESN
jgi:D-glycero-D-manno-heptose 1,7-bisphosphate phosphatase